MNKLEVQKRVLQHGKPLDLDKFYWCEETRTFSSSENNLVIDFNGEDYCIVTMGNNCIFTTSSNCSFKTGDYCTFETGKSCTFETGSNCTFTTSSGCIFKTLNSCTFKTGDYCTFETGDDCIFKTGDYCTFETGDDCTFDTSISPQFAITNDEVIKIARVCHEVNKAYCEAIGDKSQKHWGLAEDWQKESSINGINYFLKNKDCSPEDIHRAWCKQKIADGWSYGKVKDPDNKQHPCLVDYNSLPFEQQVKDQLWLAIVKSYFKK